MNTQNPSVRLAVIDDDSGFLRVLVRRFDAGGWEYRIQSSTIPSEELVAMKVNALVVDIAVLGPMAWDFLEDVCGMLPDLAVVVCTQGSTVAQRVRGLRLGVDDWIAKPAHPEEVVARIEAIVRRRRRSEPQPDRGPLVAGEVEIRRDQFQAFVAGRSLQLTRKEFELLEVLAEATGRVIEREQLYQRVWGYAMAHGDRSVDVFVRKLRSKIQMRLPRLGVHPHALRRRLSLRARAVRRHGRRRARAGRGRRGSGRGDRVQLRLARFTPFSHVGNGGVTSRQAPSAIVAVSGGSLPARSQTISDSEGDPSQ